MVTQVPEDEPVTAEVPALEVPAVLVQRVPVAEDDGDLVALLRAALLRAVRTGGVVDLDVQRNPIVREHGQDAAARRAERLRLGSAAYHPDAADRYALRRDDRSRPRGGRTRGQPRYTGNPPPASHRSSSRKPAASGDVSRVAQSPRPEAPWPNLPDPGPPCLADPCRSEEHTSELQSLRHLVC